jgi:Ni2+-binding GTPase involved in maturation of urease and hydrogenase
MKAEIEYHTDVISMADSKHKTSEEAVAVACSVLDSYKDILNEDRVENIQLSMTYLTRDAQVMVENLTLQQPTTEEPNYSVVANSLTIETVGQKSAVNLYYRLADAISIGLVDNGQGDDREQLLQPSVGHEVIELIVERKDTV